MQSRASDSGTDRYIKQKVTNLVLDKAKQAYYSGKSQSSLTCKKLF